ncbi:hypothetical protein BJX63DRAFT_433968 [Aspergillus granulosus]|uniref:Uncharacterized protein n=1 Tax=Aspergillus granulosus TaxID=176169 RepID=A0ABR4H5J6_9EURO
MIFSRFRGAPDTGHSFEIICRLLSIISDYQGPFINIEDYEMLRIETHQLDGPNNAAFRQFFTPWSELDLAKYPLDLKNEKIARAIELSDKFLRNGLPFKDLQRPHKVQIEFIVERLISEFERFPRKGTVDDELTIRDVICWRGQDNNPFSEYLDSLDAPSEPSWSIHPTYWVNSQTPHIKFVTQYDVTDLSDELLRIEVLAILAAMKHRLELDTLKQKRHVIIPVF